MFSVLKLYKSNYTVNNCVFVNNIAYAAGGLYTSHYNGPQTGTITNTKFINNQVSIYGGGLVVGGSSLGGVSV